MDRGLKEGRECEIDCLTDRIGRMYQLVDFVGSSDGRKKWRFMVANVQNRHLGRYR